MVGPAALLSLGSSAVFEIPFATVFSDEADSDTKDSSVLLLSCGDTRRSAVAVRFCCDLADEESMLVIDEDSLG